MSQNLDNVFVVECCQNPPKMSCRLDESKYNQYMADVAASIQANVPGATVLKNQVPKAWSNSDIYCQLIENRDDNNLIYEQVPRIYAFEVSYKGVLLYSKILSLMWPNVEGIGRKCQEAHAQSMAGCSDQQLRADFQTTGQGQKKKGDFRASNSMMRSQMRGNDRSPNRGSLERSPDKQQQAARQQQQMAQEPLPQFANQKQEQNLRQQPAQAQPQAQAQRAPSTSATYPPNGLYSGVTKLPEWIQLGCGDDEYICPEKGANFSAVNLPANLPDLSEHANFLTDAIKADPKVWDRLKGKTTALGVNLGHCIKTGIDNKGHPMIKTCGLVAGDEESWTLFADLFDKVVSDRHGGYGPTAKHPTDMNPANLSQTKIDPTGKYVLTTRCRTGRSVRGFRLPPCNSFEERRQIEDCLVKGLMKLDGELAGDYFPLAGSQSYAPKPNGMSESEEEALRNAGNLFQEPDSTLLLSSGCGRHWPDARGIFHNKARNFFVWINEEDHSRIISMEKGDNVHAIFNRFAKATSVIADVLKSMGKDFMHNDHLGYILTCPSNLGTGLRAGCMVKLPLLSGRKDFREICGKLGLQARGTAGVDSASTGGTWDISNADRLGKSETTLVNIFIEGVANFIRWEGMLEQKKDVEAEIAGAKPGVACQGAAAPAKADYPPLGLSANVTTLPEWIQLGCGDKEYNCPEKGATFLAEAMPTELPDLSGHNNFLTDVLKKDPSIYNKLKGKTTKLGVNLGHCIKTGIDNKGHPMIKTCGLVAGDEESWTLFADVMDQVVSDRHGGYAPDAKHPTDMNPANLSKTKIDPTGKYVLTTRCRTGRSVRGFRLPPCNSFEERRAIEDCLVKGLLKLDGELKGDYFPLAGSRSYAPKPTGMSHSEEEALRNAGNLFQEPDSTLLLSSGCGRHWPDARGIFHNEARNFFVWINEEDHSRIISMEKGDNVHAIFNRFAKATTVIADVLKSMGKDFMHNDHLGYILTCPSNLGTGLRAGCMVKLPLLSARKDFKELCGKLGLQMRGTAGVDSASTGGTWDVSNADRLGKSETTLVNIFIEGVANFVRWEGMLEKKQDIEGEIASAKPGVACGGASAGADYPPTGLSANVQTLPEWIQLGCGDAEYNCPEKGATFLAENLPAALPDLKDHNNFLTDEFKKDPSMYDRLKSKGQTKLGVNIGHCIKTGIDNKGHPMIKTCGLVAGDEESWTLFGEIMDKVVSARHGGYAPDAKHPTDMNPENLSKRKIDPTGKYVMTTRCRTGRSVRGFRLPPCNSFEERRAIEDCLVKGLMKLDGELKGDYFPLAGSRSYAAKPNGMSHDEEEALRNAGNLFQEPDSTLLLSSGCGRHWPDARGIFHNEARNFFVWINEEDHSRIISMEKGDNVHAIFNRFAKATTVIADVLKSMGKDFMHNDHLGYILTCPSNLGTGLRAGAMCKLPLLSARKDFKELCGKLSLQARGGAGVDSAAQGGVYDISNADRLGKSETTLVNIFIEGVANFIRWEGMLEKKEDIEAEIASAKPGVECGGATAGADYPPTGLSANVQTLPQWIQLGCGDAEYNCPEKGATFLAENLPADLPDLKDHNNFLTDEFKKDAAMYGRLKAKGSTKMGVNIGHCIKTGIDNKGHPMIKTCGLVAGDEESWTLFSEIMDKVVSARHGGYAPDAKHPTDMNPDNISTRKIDPTGKYVMTSRCRTGRSVRGFPLPPCNSFQQRRDIEDCLVKGLLKLDGELKGDYFPLAGSRSYAPKPTGMSHDEEEALRNAGNLFQEPDSTLLLSSGCGRHWPDARGIFHNEARNFFVWINEEDHSRIISMEKGDDVRAIFVRFAKATSVIAEVLKSMGKDFMHNDHLGYILTCPSNLGTGLRAGAMCKLPLLSARADFKDLCGKLSLQARGGAGVDSAAQGGVYDISNADRLGKSETTLVNIFIEGVANFIRWEQMLEKKEDIEAEVAAAQPGKFVAE